MTQPIRVLVYSHSFSPVIGGVETFVMQLARGLSALSGEGEGKVAALTLVTNTPAVPGADDGLPFRVVRQPSLRELLRLLSAADVVHLAGASFVPLLLARLLGKAVAIEHHGFQPVCPNGQMMHRPTELPCPGHFSAGRHLECWRCNAADGWLRSIWAWLLTFARRSLCRQVQANIVPTSWLGGVLELPRQVTIHHAVSAAAAGRLERPATGVPTFAFVGRLVSTKGVPVLLDAAAEMRRRGQVFRLLIVGDGPERGRLEAQVRRLQLEPQVRFTGTLPAAQLEDALADVTAVVLPSLGGEVFGLAAAESMARGRAVVVSDLGSLAEVVGDAGCVFRAGSAAALADQLKRVMESPSLAAQTGAGARERAIRLFDQRRMIEKHMDAYIALALDRRR